MIQKNVLEYLECSAGRFPQKTAYADVEQAITFGELSEASERLGTAIARTVGVRNRPVAVLSNQTILCPVAFMGVLQSGNFYAPIDSQMPAARLDCVLRQLSPVLILYCASERETAQRLSVAYPVLSVEENLHGDCDRVLLRSCRRAILDTDPVYVIFTSGSTGIPKGIVCHHRGVIDFTEWLSDTDGITETDVLGNQAPFYFDGSVKNLYVALKCAVTCELLEQKLFMFPKYLVQRLNERHVTVLHWATSAFHLVANSGILEQSAPVYLRTIVLGGEALRARQLNLWRRDLPQVRYINLYGPTEVTVDCTCYVIDREFSDTESIPIGYACNNKEVFLLDEQLQPVPPGTPGEICVRGLGLAKGYYADRDRTATAFIQDPRNPDYPDMIYRTGDIGCMDEHGCLYFLSRRDGQIKHMGYRIELGEIENTLSGIPEVLEVVCLFDENADRLHCVYAGDVEGNALAKTARSVLPRYMVPNFYHRLEELPHNANGKVDRAELKREYLKR